MNFRSLFPTVLVASLAVVTMTACNENPVDEDFTPVESRLVENLPADPHTGTDPVTGRPVGTGQYTFFSLREGSIVARADSASTKWDLAFNGTTILTNSGSSGPGEGGAVVVALPFESTSEAPPNAEIPVDDVGAPAVSKSEAGNWYNYNAQTHVVSPVPGRTIVVRTADGRFGKIRILSYYKDSPEIIDESSEARYYTFDYVFQDDGSRSLLSE